MQVRKNFLRVTRDRLLMFSSFYSAGKKAIISFGAWGGSGYFSSNVATAAARNTFGHQIWTMMKHYGFDGIDIDWEFG